MFFNTFFNSCQKNITVKQPPYTNKPSIQCQIEPDSIPVLYLYTTVPFFDSKYKYSDLVIRHANVSISSASGTDFLVMDSVYDKIICDYNYFYKGHTPILSNTDYTMNLVFNNETFTATCKTDLQPVTIDSVGFVKVFQDLYGEHEGVLTYFKDLPGQQNYYRFEMLRKADSSQKKGSIRLGTTCLGGDTINVIELGRSVYSDLTSDGQQFKLVIEPAFGHSADLYTQVRVATLDYNTHYFFDQLDKQKLGVFNPFVEPVFLKAGQFGDRAVGFFGSVKRSAPVDFYYPE